MIDHEEENAQDTFYERPESSTYLLARIICKVPNFRIYRKMTSLIN